MDLTNKLEQSRIDLRDNPETGYKSLLGDNALTRPSGNSLQEEVQASFRASFDQLRSQAGNARQRAALEDVYRRMSAQVDRDVATHVAHEFEVKRAAVEATAIKMISPTRRATIRKPPRTDEDAPARGRGHREEEGRPGRPSGDDESGSYGSPLRIADEEMDTQKARAYLEANRAEIDPDDLIKAGRLSSPWRTTTGPRPKPRAS